MTSLGRECRANTKKEPRTRLWITPGSKAGGAVSGVVREIGKKLGESFLRKREWLLVSMKVRGSLRCIHWIWQHGGYWWPWQKKQFLLICQDRSHTAMDWSELWCWGSEGCVYAGNSSKKSVYKEGLRNGKCWIMLICWWE